MPGVVATQVVAEVARDQVAHLAPQELVLFRAQSEAYFKNPDQVPQSRAGKDELLGFGAGEAVVLLTPIILRVTREVVGYLAEQVQKSLAAQTPGLVDELVKNCFKRFRTPGGPSPSTPSPSTPSTPPLTPAQLAEVRRRALQKALQDGLAEAQAGLLADSIVGSLVVAA